MKKTLAIALVVALALALMPAAALADGLSEVSTEEELLNARDAATDGDIIKLAADIQLNSGKLVLSGKTLTLDLNGHMLSTPDVTGNDTSKYVSAYPVLEITGGSITIKGAGTVQSGKTINSGSNDLMASSTICVSGAASLTVQDGAVVSGGDAINTGAAGHAVWFCSSGTLTVNNAKLMGGNNIKDSSVAKGNYAYDGKAGNAIYFFQRAATANITGSTIKGGDGLIRGYDTAYMDGGVNQAAGGAAIDSLNSTFTCNISGSNVKGGNSDIYNAGSAINVGAGKFTIENSTVEGGHSLTPHPDESYGIGGSAIVMNNASGDVSIIASDITGGDGGNSWIGCGIEYKNTSASLSIEDSVISGGGATGTGQGFGNALYCGSGAAANFSNVNLQDTLLQLGADPSKVYGESAAYKVGGGLEEMLDVINDEDIVFGPSGIILLGDLPAQSQATKVSANADIAYMIVITPSVDFGTIDRSMSTQTKDFVVAVEDALIEDGASISVENTTTDMTMKDKDGAGSKSLAFTLASGLFTFAQADLADGVESITSSVSCTPSQLQAAGSYKGYMTFEVDYVTP
jgi:hypothetical protein